MDTIPELSKCPICLEAKEVHFVGCTLQVCKECWDLTKINTTIFSRCPVCINCPFRIFSDTKN